MEFTSQTHEKCRDFTTQFPHNLPHDLIRGNQKYTKRHGFTLFMHKTVYNWLGRSDSNTRMTESESVALPLGESPKSFVFYLRYFIKLFHFWQAFLRPFYNFFEKI